jgi:hypothetical protein
LGKDGAEIFGILKTVFCDECVNRARTFECFEGHKEVELQSMTIRNPSDRQLAEMMVLSHACENSFVQMGD